MSVAFVPSGAARPARLCGQAHSTQTALPMGLRSSAPPGAVSLLNQARRSLLEAEREPDTARRFTGAYLSALRAAAAVLVGRGRPHRGRSKPASVWALLEGAAPELAEWSALFAANSAMHAAAQAGVTRKVDAAGADDLCRNAGRFLVVAGREISARSRIRERASGAG